MGLTAELVHRAAFLLHANRLPALPVPFTVWADGEEVAYLATSEWGYSADGPCAVVLQARGCERVCASLPGKMFDIDPATVSLDTVASDEIEQAAWEEAQRRARGKSR